MAGGLQIIHIPYKGTAPALADLLGGQVDMMCDNLGVSLPHVRSGKLKALAVASAKRVAALPNTPVLAETLPGFEAVAWFGIVAPPKTPGAIAERAEESRGPEEDERAVALRDRELHEARDRALGRGGPLRRREVGLG
jgi:tripartite-type tricarboxylate transporter receptor subunit TctC